MTDLSPCRYEARLLKWPRTLWLIICSFGIPLGKRDFSPLVLRSIEEPTAVCWYTT